MSDVLPSPTRLSRRRVLGIAGAAAGLALPPLSLAAATVPAPALHRWRGTVLGARATMVLHHPDGAVARRLIAACRAEIARLERIFSLYRQDSAVSQLNREGALAAPPADLVRLLSLARRVNAVSGGAFDPTVQPLWRLYVDHFSRPAADPSGPPAAAIEKTLRRVGLDAVAVGARQIRFTRPGMALTLNGIAQGYISDRIVDLLRAGGIARALVDLGEIDAIGRHPSGRPWRAGIADPDAPGRTLGTVDLVDCGLATSGDYGTRIDPAGRVTGIFDPRTGAAPRRYRSVTVRAPSAGLADALSTAFFVTPRDVGLAMTGRFPNTGVVVVGRDGRVSWAL